ncbi:MAG: DUF2892 domain-containing protein [bacterium]
MKLERTLRLVAGFFVLVSLTLFYVHSKYWILMTFAVGFSLFQSGFTNWRPMMSILKLCGLKSLEKEVKELKGENGC